MIKGIITEFQNENRWLSNFADDRAITVEHRYQAAKAINDADRNRILAAPKPHDAKKLGRGIIPRSDWDDIKLIVMEQLLLEKFTREPFRSLLLDTKGMVLIEGNNWHDNFWGSCRCSRYECGSSGQNHLGRLIMKIRDEYLVDAFDDIWGE